MRKPIPRRFADVTAMLEDLHSLAVEGQRADNAADMQAVLVSHLQSGLAALDVSMRAMAATIDRGRP